MMLLPYSQTVCFMTAHSVLKRKRRLSQRDLSCKYCPQKVLQTFPNSVNPQCRSHDKIFQDIFLIFCILQLSKVGRSGWTWGSNEVVKISYLIKVCSIRLDDRNVSWVSLPDTILQDQVCVCIRGRGFKKGKEGNTFLCIVISHEVHRLHQWLGIMPEHQLTSKGIHMSPNLSTLG